MLVDNDASPLSSKKNKAAVLQSFAQYLLYLLQYKYVVGSHFNILSVNTSKMPLLLLICILVSARAVVEGKRFNII